MSDGAIRAAELARDVWKENYIAQRKTSILFATEAAALREELTRAKIEADGLKGWTEIYGAEVARLRGWLEFIRSKDITETAPDRATEALRGDPVPGDAG